MRISDWSSDVCSSDLRRFGKADIMSIKHIVLMLLAVLGASQAAAQAEDGKFTIAVVPDTQYYTDYRHQTEEGFQSDARDLFFDQMQYIAPNEESAGDRTSGV